MYILPGEKPNRLCLRGDNLKLVIFLTKQMTPRNFLEISIWVRA